MRIVMAGASGFLGTAWREHLAREGHEVVRLVRGRAATPHESEWDPYAGRVDPDVVASADVVANLAGASIGRVPWTSSYAATVRRSRVATTRTLAEAVAACPRPPALLAQSGIAGYGDGGETVLDEDSPADADTVLGEVTRSWEAAAEPAVTAGARVVWMRSGVVLHRSGGALHTMLPAFRLGLGGRIGSGRQYFATIVLQDWVRAATFLATHQGVSGVVNLTAPEPATNAEFTRALAARLHRPARLPVPAAVIRLVGPIGGEILASQRVVPRRLLEAGFAFDHPTIGDQVAAALS